MRGSAASASTAPPWRAPKLESPRRAQKRSHIDSACYITVIWGFSLVHILEAIILGMRLQATSIRKRICFVDKESIALRSILELFWEVREFEHLDMGGVSVTGASARLSKVYSKLQAWSWLSGEAEAAILLDTDLFVKGSLDSNFYLVQHAAVAGVFRGKGDFALNRPRPQGSIKTAERKRKGRGGGGINGGFVVFRPDECQYQELLQGLKDYVAPDRSGGEQDYLSQFFGLTENIAQVGLQFNFQLHQLSLTAQFDDARGPWMSLVQRPE
jgi:hypothetical protein